MTANPNCCDPACQTAGICRQGCDSSCNWCACDDIGAIEPAPEKIVSDGSSSSYYELPAGAKEIQDLVEFRNMNFSIGNIFKACYRLGRKAGNDDLYDIRKILWYANREEQRLTKLKQEK